MKQTALITGASGGIGMEFARIFAGNSYDLVLVARSGDKLQQLAGELKNTTCTIISQDLSKIDSPKEVYDEVTRKNIQVDALVNNAGFGDFGFFHETKWDKEAMMIDLNMRSLTQMTKLFGGDMVNRKSGKILNVASTAAFQPGPTMAVYYATKAYVWSFSIAIANEWKDFGVTVTCLSPGPTESGFQEASNIVDSRLVKGKKLPSAHEVAEFGFNALMSGKTSVIHGFKNQLFAFGAKVSPGKLAAGIARNLQGKD